MSEGIPLLRISDITDEGTIDLSNVKFITAEKSEKLISTQVGAGDLVISQRGSIGMPAVISNERRVFNISANLIAIRKLAGLNPRFVQLYLACNLGERQIARLQSGQVHPKITTDDVASVLIPAVNNQEALVSAMDAARAERRAKLAEADALLAGVDDFLLATLGLTPPPKDDRKVFAVRRGELDRKQIGANLYAPALRVYLRALATGPHPTRPLSQEVAVNPSVTLEGLTDESLVSFVPMEAVEDKAAGGIALRDRELGEVKKGYTPFGEGDILWAKITPCMENGKSGIACRLTNGVGFGSTEFHVLRPLSERVSAEYVHEFISQATLRRVARYAFTGSAGHQRVPAEFLEQLPLPVPPPAIQETIADEARRRREEARRLRAEAEAGWQAAKRWFEEQLLGPAQP